MDDIPMPAGALEPRLSASFGQTCPAGSLCMPNEVVWGTWHGDGRGGCHVKTKKQDEMIGFLRVGDGFP